MRLRPVPGLIPATGFCSLFVHETVLTIGLAISLKPRFRARPSDLRQGHAGRMLAIRDRYPEPANEVPSTLASMVLLSAATKLRLDVLFPGSERSEAEELLIEAVETSSPFLDQADEIDLERFRFAVLKLSDGRMEGLRDAVNLAKIDWRDLLMAAGFGEDVDAHNHWMPAPDNRAEA